jgi:hypothetical protein
MRVRSTVSWLEPMLSTLILMPVAAAKSASDEAKFVPSPPTHWVWMETVLPLNGLAAPRAEARSV